jgi:PAS domain S-box-containing protein
MSKAHVSQCLFLGAALLLIGSAIGWNLYEERIAIDARERERLATLANVIAENLGRQLLATNSALKSIRADLPLPLKNSRGVNVQLERRLQVMCDVMAGVRTILIMNADGEVIASNRSELIGQNFREAERFSVTRRGGNPDTLYVSPPFRTPLGVYAIGATKVVVGDRGEFEGVIMAILDPEYFKTLLASVRYAPDMWTAIVHSDGKLFLFEPARPGTEEMDLAQPGSFYTRHRDSAQQTTVMTGTAYATGEPRMAALRTLKPANVPMDKALLLAVSRDLPSIFAMWRTTAYKQALLFLLLVLGSGAGLFFHLRRQQADADRIEEQEAERKRLELSLVNKEEHLRTLVATTPVGVFETDQNGKCIFVNERWADITGLSREAAIGDGWTKALHPEDRDKVYAEWTASAVEGRRFNLEYRFLRPDGRITWILCQSDKIRSANGELLGHVGSITDLTERKQAEVERARLEAQLRESQKMESLGTLAGGVAHDFNNALAAIIGNVALARQDVGPGHAALESLDEIGKASRRAKDLVQQILAFGRRQPLARKPTTLSMIVLETARLVRATLPADVTLNVDCNADVPAALVDTTQIKQILLNLCSNAMYALHDQGRPGVIEIRLENYTQDEARDDLKPGHYACLTVRDNGPGMDEETRSRIFEPFFTTKPKGKGTGLGLSVVHGIVKAHEASIDVTSAPGEGTEFRIYFPAIDAQGLVVAAPVSETAPINGRGRRVLYVDDEEAIVFLMKRLLERQGFRVSTFTNQEEALAAMRADPHQFDLAVTDYNMPGMSGLDVAIAIREIRADLPVVMASGYITEELRAKAPAAGIRDLIYKPNSVDDLCEAVARFANSQSAIGSPS